MQQAVDQKQIAGIVTILARHGKVVDYRAYGQRDMASGAPMTKDTIFRDYSMTKPVTGVAMMILYEQGKWLPSDPIAKFIPEFAHLKVFKGVDADGKMILVDPGPRAHHARADDAYGGLHLRILRQHAGRRHVPRPAGARLQKPAGVDRQAGHGFPLLYQPGKGWTYSRVDGYSGLHRREAVGPVAARLHARPDHSSRWG